LIYNIKINKKTLINIIKILLLWGLGIGDWGLGIGDWGLGIGDLGPSPKTQPPTPNPNYI